MRAAILLACLGLLIGAVNCYGKNNPVDICSGVDISGENRPNPEDMLDKVWYLHFIIDPENQFDVDAKVIYKPDASRVNLIAYQVGRNKRTRKCSTLVYQDSQLVRRRPCISTKQIFPPSSEEPQIYVQILQSRERNDNSHMMWYYCADYDRKRQRCKHNKVTVIGATTRKNLLPGEREGFEAKLRQFSGFVPRYRVDRPASNDCEVEVQRALGDLPAVRPNRMMSFRRNNYH